MTHGQFLKISNIEITVKTKETQITPSLQDGDFFSWGGGGGDRVVNNVTVK